MILNPTFRSAVDTNTRRTEIEAEVKRQPRRQAISFDDLRRAVASVRDLSDAEIGAIAQAVGLEVIYGGKRNGASRDRNE